MAHRTEPRSVLLVADGKAPAKRDWERLSRRWYADIADRIVTLEALQTRLTGCIGCGCLSLKTCALFNPSDEAAMLGPGARYFRAPPGE